ncbi:polysaccharide deacetylase family protein [Streptococcus suis]|nr:polysaccharide deacetylase family protein [Streptococcus suis]
MKRLGFWIGLNIVLVVMLCGLIFLLFTRLKERQVSQFIEVKQEKILSRGKGKIQEGNIGTTHVVATLPIDEAGQTISHIENKMLSYIENRLGHKKPAGKIKKLVFVSAKDGHTNFKNVTAKEIQAEHYQVENLQIKETENLSTERVLLTQDNQLFTLGKFLTDLSTASDIIANKLSEHFISLGKTEAEAQAIATKFKSLDCNTLTFSYADSNLTIFLPDASYGLESISVPISDFFSVVKSEYLVDSDKQAYDDFIASQQDKKVLRQIALTFDDGPNPATTPVILDLLKKYNVKATFFVLGSNVEGKEAILQRMVAEGHEVANHTWSHPNLTHLSTEQVKQEIEMTQAIVEKAIGKRPTMMRPPFGAVNQTVVNAMGLPSIYWNVDTEDWLSRDSNAIFARVQQQACPGCIILMHDIHQTTVDSLEPVLQFLTSEGYNLVTTSELLGPNLNPQHIYYDQEANGPAQH